ncbi:type I-E CRISPR-associated protein Cas5/CasD [Streptomyces sp. 1331.2]|uniref:type I-E CRISPR-associated protein Cas5/CasD n=1 Tax=Streptomyces sp. 1331.2 TaxID=1938835 RepID=UPI000BDB715D|nr:type I-E CRISPR-associated protein Cas5/CasD [Streptomyces sp. 1331.2]SOB88486.1 CRISPR-associated protein, Cas5e family [Streptomyces sp. 1331.2]
MSPATLDTRGLLLHLAAPLQSWGETGQFNERDTAPFPTRSGVIGLLAAALGRKRGDDIGDLARLSLTVRTDRPGTILRDLHTVGGGLPAARTVTTAEGKKRTGATATLLSHRYYLADAAFTAVVTIADPADPEDLDRWAEALRNPHWPPYLGRRSCPPEGPLLLGLVDDPLHHLVHLPIARRARAGTRTVDVLFHSDQPLDRLGDHPQPGDRPRAGEDDGSTPAGEVTDDPLTFHPRRRAYRARPRYQRTLTLPADRCRGLAAGYLTALGDYLDRHTTHPGRPSHPTRPESVPA